MDPGAGHACAVEFQRYGHQRTPTNDVSRSQRHCPMCLCPPGQRGQYFAVTYDVMGE